MPVSTQELVALDPAGVSPDEFCDRLFAYLEEAGQSMYDETVTQLEHGLQCAALAERAGYGADAQVAALLHDIGHLVLDEHDGREDFLEHDHQHEIVGARLVTRWFGPHVGAPVALHVAAKRYLVAVDPGYRAGLSTASVRSLEVQGGPMADGEVERFTARPHSGLAVELRRWDDLGKAPGAEVANLEYWRHAVLTCLAARMSSQDDERRGACEPLEHVI